MKKKLLICDDEECVRKSLKVILADQYDIVFAEDGRKAIEVIEQNPDLKGILLDIKMPRLNGLELLQYVKKHNKQLPVVVVTGYQSVEAAAETLKTGAVNYITKPFQSETVLETVRQSIS